MYRGYIGPKTKIRSVFFFNKEQAYCYPLPLRTDLRNHSPDGFAWGYGGSGPAQLALALLAHRFNDAWALKYHQAFKHVVIMPLPIDEEWELSTLKIDEGVWKSIEYMQKTLKEGPT